MVRVAAVDLGATSGRVCAVTVGPDRLDMEEIHRFVDPTVLVPNPQGGTTLTLDILAIWAGIIEGLRRMYDAGPVDSIGIDSWAVDYGLLDEDGALLANPTNYRDNRTNGMGVAGFDEVYRRTGIQFLPFNTIFQLGAEKRDNYARLSQAQTMLMLPDLFNYWLTGNKFTEITNASSTSLVSPVKRDWDFKLIRDMGIPKKIFTEIIEPGKIVGKVITGANPGKIGRVIGCGAVPVVAVASHDTASAIVAVPMDDAAAEKSAYISSGTWSLVGLELDAPVLTDKARSINATNELGVDGTVRFLRNTMGLWLLSQSQEQWKREGKEVPLTELLAGAAATPPLQWVIDADSNDFLEPGDMATRIAAAARPLNSAAKPDPETPAEIARCIFDSLALAYAKSIAELSAAAGRKVEVIHIVGGGSLNSLLCQLTADATGCRVVAGPVEAAALGNALVQARALGVITGGLPQMRELVRKTQPLTEYQPNPNHKALWEQAANQLGENK